MEVDSLAWSPDSKMLISGSFDGSARVWDVSNGHTVARFDGFGGTVYGVAWSPDGKYVAAGATGGKDPLRVYDTTNWQSVFADDPSLNGPNDAEISNVAWSPDGKKLAVGLGGSTTKGVPVDSWIKVYEVAGWKNTATLVTREGVGNVAWSPDGKFLTFASGNESVGGLRGRVVAWNPSIKQGNAQAQDTTTLVSQDDFVFVVAWSPDGKRIATDYGRIGAKIWNVASGQDVATFSGHTATVKSVAWSPDGKRIASGAWDFTVKVWDVASGQNVTTFTNPDLVNSVAWSPDGKLIASGCSDHNIWLWEVK